MKYRASISTAHNDPRALEELYRAARRAHEVAEFTSDLATCYEQAPDNVLYAAWHCRLQPAIEEQAAGLGTHWLLAIPLSLASALVFWLLSAGQFEFRDGMPYLIMIGAPLAALSIIAFLALLAGSGRRRALAVSAGLVALTLYAFLLALRPGALGYRTLMLFHLPLLAAIAVWLALLGRKGDAENLFAVLVKSIEVLITGGVFVIVGGMFMMIGFGMFAALNVWIPNQLMQRLILTGAGAIPVLAVATVYDPRLRPVEQKFEQGLGKLVPIVTRLLLPLTLLVLVTYLVVIPFRFMEPFRNREVLIVYNAMLFAIMGLLVGVTPMQGDELPRGLQRALRTGILAVAALTVVISVYALSATVYRTVLGGITMNRLTVIGWNTINIAILGLFLYRQAKDGPRAWVRSLQRVAAVGIIGYVVWTVFLVVAIPWVF